VLAGCAAGVLLTPSRPRRFGTPPGLGMRLVRKGGSLRSVSPAPTTKRHSPWVRTATQMGLT